jgi:hypothetical protein
MDVFSAILMISVNDGVCQGFPQRDLNVALPFRNAAAIPEQEHEFVHEGRNRSHFAWQGALQSDMRVPVIMRCRHSETTLPIEIGLPGAAPVHLANGFSFGTL